MLQQSIKSLALKKEIKKTTTLDDAPFDELSEEEMDKKTKELVTCMFQFARNLAQEVGWGVGQGSGDGVG